MLMPLVGGRYAENGTTQDYLIIIAPENVMKKRKKQQKKKNETKLTKSTATSHKTPTRRTSMQVEF